MLSLATLLTRLRWARACVLVVAAVVAGGAWLPSFASVLLGGPEHVCHCSSSGGHAHCACPICVPELREDAPLSGPVASGTCGDEPRGIGAEAVRAVAPSFVAAVVPAPASRLAPASAPNAEPGRGRAPPPTPPPEVGPAARS